MSAGERKRRAQPADWERLERAENQLWRISLLMLGLLALALAVNAWEQLRPLPPRLEAVPIGIVVLIVLFALYAWKKKREADRLRAFLRSFQEGEPVSSHQQMERLVEVISRSQQGYRELIDSFDDAVFSILLDGTIQTANRRTAKLLGRDFANLIGHPLGEFLDEPRWEEMQALVGEFQKRRCWSGVVRVRPAHSGQVRYFRVVLNAITKDDVVVGASGLGRDVTAERESEARFTELFETLQEGVYFSTPDGRLLDANPALVRMLGYDSKDELLGVSVNELYWSPADRPQVLRELEQNPTLHDREITLRRRDGGRVVCLDSSTVIRDYDGRVLRYQGTLVDITVRKEMEKRLRREQEFARSLVDCFPDLIVVLDAEGRYTYVSPRVRELLGYAPEELVGETLGGRMRAEGQQAARQLFGELVSGRRRFGTVEYDTLHKNGSWRTFRATASPLYDAQGRITGVVASARDVTEVKRLEQQVIQSEKLAAMGQMIAGVAHELNNPLTAILGVCDLLRERRLEDPSQRQLDLMHQQARRAAHIVQNLLAFARPPAPNRARLNLADLLERAVRLQEFTLRSSRITVELEPAPNLPFIVGDPNQLMQVFLNLLINAEQAIRSSREAGSIRIRFGHDRQLVWVRVEDDGPGIPADLLPKIFDPFFTTKRPDRGTGLGLSICLAIVREHRGRIEAEPASAGGGTVFTLWLPVATDSAATAGKSEGSAEAERPAAPPETVELRREVRTEASTTMLEGLSVLVADDEESIRELAAHGLGVRGARVDCVGTAAEMEERLAHHGAPDTGYDAILCDWNLPQLDRGEWVERLRAQSGSEASGPACVFMTGEFLGQEDRAWLESHRCGLLQKPFRIAELAAAVSRAVEGARPRVS